MSRRIRNWCHICRDLEPDIKCSVTGCGKKYHEACLKNASLWSAEDIDIQNYVCPDCKDSNVNDNTCYICHKNLEITASSSTANDRKKRKKSQAEVTGKTGGKAPDDAVDRSATSPDSDTNLDRGRMSERQTRSDETSLSGSDDRQKSSDSPEDNITPPRMSTRASKRSLLQTQEEESNTSGDGHVRKSDSIDDVDYVLCDGCTNSAHLSCLGLEKLPQEDEGDLWFCPDCDPNSATVTEMAKTQQKKEILKQQQSSLNACSRNKIGGNVDICYVCQKGGRLLGCDFCEQAFHPRCIDADFLEFENTNYSSETTDQTNPEIEKWRCPICKGEDPLKNMAHKRMSRTAMMKLGREWQDCIKATQKICKANRDKFLWECREALLPFVTEKTLARLRKLYVQETVSQASLKAKTLQEKNAGRRRRRRKVTVDDEDTLSDDSHDNVAEKKDPRKAEEEAAIEAYNNAVALAKEKKSPILKEGVFLKMYQTIGVGWLLNAFQKKAGAILADEMGLGKTIQCLAFLSALKNSGITGPYLVVVPLSTVGNWAREIRKFVPHLKFVKICGSRSEREHMMTDQSKLNNSSAQHVLSAAFQGLYDLYITTYETVVTEESFFCDNFSWQCLILDEAHRIKNESGRIRHSLDRVAANMRVLLTGTPLQNNIRELFTLLNFLFPDVLKDSDKFEKVFVRGNETNDQSELNDMFDEKAVYSLCQLLGKMMLRRTKDLVVKLPRKIEHDVWLPLSPTSAFWYKKLLDVSEAAFQQQSVKKILGTVIKMRICCCHPKGLVTKDVQLKKFKEVFSCLGEEEEAEVTKAAQELREMKGEQHIRASTKLTALDKLLVQLHVENMEASEQYARDYCQNTRDIYVRENPLQPLPMIKLPKSNKRKEKNQPEAVHLAGSEPPKTEVKNETNEARAESEPTSGTRGAVKEDDGTLSSKKPETTGSPNLTYRQQIEKLRKERIASNMAQQYEYDRKIERIGEDAMKALSPTADNSHLFWEHMLPAKITLDDEPGAQDESGLILANEEESHSEEDSENEDQDADKEDNDDEEDDDEDEEEVKKVSKDEEKVETTNEKMKSEEKGDMKQLQGGTSDRSEIRQPHKVLVFTQFQIVLDELEQYCQYRGFKYLRLDGSTNKMIRELDIREFNTPNSSYLVYFICTRAGGVGINLITANHVVLFDEDWNPFIDLQAIDRAHRIGQKRDVHVWKLITEWTVEERMAFRRMQKLKLDRLLIQANTSNEIEEVDEAEAQSEKFSVEEIKRLIRHGRAAVRLVSGQDEEVVNQKLESLIARERKTLPELNDEDDMNGTNENVTVSPDLNENDTTVTMKDVLAADAENDEVTACDNEGGSESRTVSAGTTTEDAIDDSYIDENDRSAEIVVDDDEVVQGAISNTAESLEEMKRSRRLRRRVPIYQPVVAEKAKPKVERKLTYDKKCFKCGSGNNEPSDPLFRCHRCPKVYHLYGCLGFEEVPKKTWTCPWHECCLCFRKGSQAGGILIHCAECPTTFCFDCFPPEYRKYTPPAAYYADLSKRGYTVSMDNLVLFLCSRCKALKEQQRRRLLSRQQLEAEMKKRREANLKARADAQKAKQTDDVKNGTGESKSDAKKNFSAKKRQVDDLDREQLKQIRDAYEKLYPPELTEMLKQKKQNQLRSSEAHKNNEESKAGAHHGESDNNMNSTEVKEDGDNIEHHSLDQPQQQQQPSQAPSATLETNKSGVTKSKLFVAKTPSEFFKYCENCHLPCHEISACPFPAESEKKKITVEEKIQQQNENLSSSQAAGEYIGDEEQQKEEAKAHSAVKEKKLVRSFCSKCGISSRNHFRRHCELLTPEELEEYAARRELIKKFIEVLKETPSLSLAPGTELNVINCESIKRSLQKKADFIVAEALINAGLKECVQTATAKSGRNVAIAEAKLKRKKRYSDGEGSADERTGDANYVSSLDENDSDSPIQSPRKKSKLDQTGDEEEDDVYITPEMNGSEMAAGAKRERRRRYMTNFKDLADDDNYDSAEDDESGNIENVDVDKCKDSTTKTGAKHDSLARSAGPSLAQAKTTKKERKRVSTRSPDQQTLLMLSKDGMKARTSQMEGGSSGAAPSDSFQRARSTSQSSGSNRLPPSRWVVQGGGAVLHPGGNAPTPRLHPMQAHGGGGYPMVPPPGAWGFPPPGYPIPSGHMMNFFGQHQMKPPPGFMQWLMNGHGGMPGGPSPHSSAAASLASNLSMGLPLTPSMYMSPPAFVGAPGGLPTNANTIQPTNSGVISFVDQPRPPSVTAIPQDFRQASSRSREDIGSNSTTE